MEETNKEELFSKKKPGILKLTDETMKEASESIKEKGIKTSHLMELSEMGIKNLLINHAFLFKLMLYALQKVMKRYCPLLKYHMSMILLMIVSLKNIILG
jgi:N12 class adenine-specific DNA methylase